jgi:hypothetical protein
MLRQKKEKNRQIGSHVFLSLLLLIRMHTFRTGIFPSNGRRVAAVCSTQHEYFWSGCTHPALLFIQALATVRQQNNSHSMDIKWITQYSSMTDGLRPCCLGCCVGCRRSRLILDFLLCFVSAAHVSEFYKQKWISMAADNSHRSWGWLGYCNLHYSLIFYNLATQYMQRYWGRQWPRRVVC